MAETAVVKTDIKQFRSTLGKYVYVSGKTLEEELPRRLRRLLFAAYQKTPLAKTAEINDAIGSIKFITWYIEKSMGVTPGPKPRTAPGFHREDWNKATAFPGHEFYGNNGDPRIKNLASRRSARYYGKAGFLKAIRQLESRFPATATGKALRQTGRIARMPHEVAVRDALDQINKYLEAAITWPAKDARDVSGKEKIYREAIRKGLSSETRDMEKYITRKLKEQAKLTS